MEMSIIEEYMNMWFKDMKSVKDDINWTSYLERKIKELIYENTWMEINSPNELLSYWYYVDIIDDTNWAEPKKVIRFFEVKDTKKI